MITKSGNLRRRKWAKHKAVAQRHAKMIRAKGYHARVVKQSAGGYVVLSDIPPHASY